MSFVTYRDAPVAPASMLVPTYKYWRIVYTAINDPQGLYVINAECNMREALGIDGPMAAAGTPSASSFFQTGYEANKALDGVTGTAWICGAGAWNGAWWKMTFTAPRTVRQLKLQSFNSAAGAGQMPKAFRLEASNDNVSWITKLTVASATAWGVNEIRVWDIPEI